MCLGASNKAQKHVAIGETNKEDNNSRRVASVADQLWQLELFCIFLRLRQGNFLVLSSIVSGERRTRMAHMLRDNTRNAGNFLHVSSAFLQRRIRGQMERQGLESITGNSPQVNELLCASLINPKHKYAAVAGLLCRSSSFSSYLSQHVLSYKVLERTKLHLY